MIALFSKEQLLEAYIEEEKQNAVSAAQFTFDKAMAAKLHDIGMDASTIAQLVNQSVDTVNGWLNTASI